MDQYCPECAWQIEIAGRMVRKDRKQRWVYHAGNGVYSISELPMPHREAVSVYWMPIPGCIAHSYRPAKVINPAIGAL